MASTIPHGGAQRVDGLGDVLRVYHACQRRCQFQRQIAQPNPGEGDGTDGDGPPTGQKCPTPFLTRPAVTSTVSEASEMMEPTTGTAVETASFTALTALLSALR